MKDIREIYNGKDLPDISGILEKIGLQNVTMPRIGGGHSTDVFDTGFGQVIKVMNKDVAAEEGGIRPASKYVLQPVYTYDLNGMYEVAVFPKLRTTGVMPHHSAMLKAMLAKEGYDFSDDKVANVGLSDDGIPYVIDSDAIRAGRDGRLNKMPASYLAHAMKWPDSQWTKLPYKVITSHKSLTQEKASPQQNPSDFKVGRNISSKYNWL